MTLFTLNSLRGAVRTKTARQAMLPGHLFD